jgi:hypothetical protein
LPGRFSGSIRHNPIGGPAKYIRAQFDYASFATKRFWALAVGAVGLLVGAATLISSPLALALALAALIFGLGVFIIDAMAAHRLWSRFKCTPLLSLFPIENVKQPLGYQDATYLAFEGRGTMLVHAEADRILQQDRLPFKLDETAYDLPAELREIAPLALRTMRSDGLIFNGRNLGLRDDLIPGVSSQSRPLRLIRTRFFEQICSGELCQYKIEDRINRQEMEVRLRELVAPSGRLVTLAESRLANNIGISTLAFTSEGLLLIGHQSWRNTSSKRLLAPSGSGTLDQDDLKSVDQDASLQDLLAYGMEREMCEETGVNSTSIVETRVVGFGRWLERGAKPEFFGLTRLNIPAAVAAKAKISSEEKVFSDEENKIIFVDLDQLRQEILDGYTVTKAPSCPVDVRDSGSLPLIAGLRAAALYGPEWLGLPG